MCFTPGKRWAFRTNSRFCQTILNHLTGYDLPAGSFTMHRETHRVGSLLCRSNSRLLSLSLFLCSCGVWLSWRQRQTRCNCETTNLTGPAAGVTLSSSFCSLYLQKKKRTPTLRLFPPFFLFHHTRPNSSFSHDTWRLHSSRLSPTAILLCVHA